MKTIKYIAFYSLLASAFFTSCTSSDDNLDTEPPVVDLIAPADGAKLEAGKDIHFDMNVSDNVALATYNVDIHGNFDGHGHGDGNHTHSITVLAGDHTHDAENEARKEFKFNETWDDIYGKKNDNVHHHKIIIAADAKRGNYHFAVKVLDKAGNQTMVFRNIEIVDPGHGDGGDHSHHH
ncbi:DUF4625 domain-containing protein [Myroides pelagicus]|uniref:DUF4625 domain-containing protein n=1 Tax=Myroides pelagicus TaxID=270914 RepID=A0A7K1GJL2_9FLAO|nr:DUF4625 domain-containing protein [Myroides pelagicus]MEC4113019.1 DUF4625 domain-containing protein [Myroides pelagicus]MTH28978.1 DUF4625 domain-containing protein [Myroides pelagicus]